MKRYLSTLSGTTQESVSGFGTSENVVARSLCAYRCFDLREVPSTDRSQGLTLRVRQWSPFENTDYCCAWHDHIAQVWAWDETQRLARLADLNVKKANTIPEPLLYPRPEEQHIRLISCLDGFEAQYWHDGFLKESHWWEHRPEGQQWRRFLRSCSLPSNSEAPAPETPSLQAKPWARLHTSSSDRSSPALRYAPPLALLATMAWSGWELGRTWHWDRMLVDTRAQISTLETGLEPLLTAQTAALRDHAWISDIASLIERPSQLAIIHRVFANAPERSEFKLSEWKYSNNRLSITVDGSGLVPSDLVTAYDAVPGFADVSATSGDRPGRMVLRIRITEASEP